EGLCRVSADRRGRGGGGRGYVRPASPGGGHHRGAGIGRRRHRPGHQAQGGRGGAERERGVLQGPLRRRASSHIPPRQGPQVRGCQPPRLRVLRLRSG
ncbi:MAG: hypothetical protein AVDCRST_MAG25-1330, partial [uncultured Rubrobacteraceae bacterium]